MISGGRVAIVAVAIIGPHIWADSALLVKNCMPVASVFDSKSLSTSSGHRYWFHMPRNARIVTTAMAGFTFGNTIWISSLKVDAPSILAASIRSCGSWRMFCRSRNTKNAVPGSDGMITAAQVFIHPRSDTRM